MRSSQRTLKSARGSQGTKGPRDLGRMLVKSRKAKVESGNAQDRDSRTQGLRATGTSYSKAESGQNERPLITDHRPRTTDYGLWDSGTLGRRDAANQEQRADR